MHLPLCLFLSGCRSYFSTASSESLNIYLREVKGAVSSIPSPEGTERKPQTASGDGPWVPYYSRVLGQGTLSNGGGRDSETGLVKDDETKVHPTGPNSPHHGALSVPGPSNRQRLPRGCKGQVGRCFMDFLAIEHLLTCSEDICFHVDVVMSLVSAPEGPM